MASIPFTESEIGDCKTFLQNIVDGKNAAEHDNHFESLCFCLTDAEISGEVVDIINRYLHLRYDYLHA